MQLVVQFVGIFHWLNPLYWLAASRSRFEREVAADQFVLANGERPSAYASHLLAISRDVRKTDMPQELLLGMARASQLEERLVAILDATADVTSKRWVPMSGLLAFGLVCLMLISACSIQPKESDRSIADQMLAELRSEQGPEVITIVVLGESLARQLPYDYTGKDERFLDEVLQDPDLGMTGFRCGIWWR